MNKYIVLVSFDSFLGGAQIRYLSLFKEISIRKNDYTLIINRRLYELAVEAQLIDKNMSKIVIFEVDKGSSNNNSRSNNIKHYVKSRKSASLWIKFLSNFRNKLLSLKKLVLYTYKLHMLFKKQKPDYVYGIWIGGMLSWSLKYIHKFKFVYSFMDSGFSSIYKGLGYPLKNERLPLKYADTISFLSEDLYKGVKNRIKLKKHTKIGISPCSFKNYDNIKPETEKSNLVIFCSRLTPIKNPMLFLKSIERFNQINDHWKDIRFEILGDGACLFRMIEYKREKKLDNVFILGYIKNPVDYLKKSKIFVSIQQANNYPSQSILEAMACENAIIASDVGETRKLVSEKEGILVSLNAEEIAKAINKLLVNESLRDQLGKNAREKVIHEHNVDNYLEYFYSLEAN